MLYLAMDYVDGVDLRELLRREGRLEPERAVAIVAQAGEALDAAHAAGLVHRDVKPGNMLVADGPDGEHAYVCDFGVARHVASVGSLTGDRGFVGTVDYVAPEQIRGEEVDGRADVYALGCVLFECVAGERPVRARERARGRLRPSERAAAAGHGGAARVGGGMGRVVARALAKEPKERYASCGDLATAASDALHGRAVPSRRSRRRIASPSARRGRGRGDRYGAGLPRRRLRRRSRPGSGRSCSTPSMRIRGASSQVFARARGSGRGTRRPTSSSPAARRGFCCRASSGSCASTLDARATRSS